MFGLTKGNIAEVRAVLAGFAHVEKVLVYGSRAKGDFKNGSDIDLALFGESLQREDLLKIGEILNEETVLPYFFDLLLFKNVENQRLKEHILRVGKVLYERKQSGNNLK